ncbi:hypothetical protein [Candidatus Viridilinea mediisalina]|uniref:hypothetical protein n=1 Tax=Candidatus Viridilinea mediisalina TaxID=2024553 RepID=UPI0013FDE5D6|nr:hypothetical protein [Candidatus Viridilinea mediisalina]
MNFTIGANDQQFELRIRIHWQSVSGITKALLTVITAILSFLAAPEVVELGVRLGFW